MSFDRASILFFVLAVLALTALELVRDRADRGSAGERFGWLAVLAMLAHPLAWWLADTNSLRGDLTPFLALDLVAAGAIGACVANGAPGGKAFAPLLLVSALALSLGVQQLPGTSAASSDPGITGALLASVMLCAVFVGAAAECARHARLDRATRRPSFLLALLCGAAAVLQLIAALLVATMQEGTAPAVQLLAATGTLWLLLKLMLASTLIRLFAARRARAQDSVSLALVDKANIAMHDLRVVAQAFYQMPGKAMVTDAGGRILFANADARRMLAYPEIAEQRLEDLFVAVQPTGHQQVRALFEKPGREVELVQIRMTGVECGGRSYHLLQLEPMPFDYATLRSLLVDSRSDAPHEATGLLDHHFAIAAMADGWFRLLDPVDRYAASGLFWDKLRLLSASDSEISYLESSIATASDARGWLQLRSGGGLAVSLHKLHTPDHKLLYRAELALVDDVVQTGAHAPCAAADHARAERRS